MSLITALTLAGFTNAAHAESPFINPVSLADFAEWELNNKTGNVSSVEMDGPVEVPLYTDEKGAPTMKTYMTTDATEEGERGDLVQLLPETSLIVVSEDFAKRNDLEIKVTNKRLIPVPDDFKVGGEIKYVKIPSINLGGLVLNDVTALIAGSEKKINGSTFQGMTIGLGALPTSYAVLNSKGVIKFSDDGAGLMSEVGAKGVPYKSQTIMIGTIGEKDLFGSKKTLLKANALIVDASFNGSSESVSTALTFGKKSSSLDKYVNAAAEISSYNADIRQDWLTATIGETSLPTTYVNRATYQSFSDGLSTMGRIGNGVLIAYDIVVDKTSETIGMVEHDGFSFTSYYPIHLEEARKALEPKEETTEESAEGSESTDSTDEETEALNVAGINGLISALEVAGGYTEALEQYGLLIADEEEQTDCQLWLNYGHAQRITGNLDEAHKAYTESARLYHSWWDIDLGRRMDINKAQGGMESEEIDAAKERSKDADINSVEDGWYISQPEACYRADGFVAAVDMLNGKHDAVESNYRSNLDLDAKLALVFGNSALSQGKTELAHEAFRQAIKLENGAMERAYARHALALVYTDQGKWEQANALFQESLEIMDNPLNAMMWLDNAIAQMGADEAVKMVQDWSVTHPAHHASRVAELRYWATLVSSLTPETAETEGEEAPTVDVELTEEEQAALDAKAEQLAAATASFDVAKKAFSNWVANVDRWKYNSPESAMSTKIIGYTYAGDLTQAGQLLDSVKGQISSSASLTFAAANYYALSGQSKEAAAAMQQLSALQPHFSGSAIATK